MEAIPFLDPASQDLPVCKDGNKISYEIPSKYRYGDGPGKPRELSLSDRAGRMGLGAGEVTPDMKVIWNKDSFVSGALGPEALRECRTSKGENLFDIYARYLKLISTGVEQAKGIESGK